MFYRILAVVGIVALAGCATPDVVQVEQIDDEQLSCTELRDAIVEAENFEAEARGERKVTGTNVAAAVFFWPGLVGTYLNTEEAIEAAEERQEHLHELYTQKNCRA
ncbi:MAG: hypothetical protein ACOC3D_03180 [Pseudomonadota bacterium]